MATRKVAEGMSGIPLAGTWVEVSEVTSELQQSRLPKGS
jgi:hypothetical protein